nr:hypothetical transcript [Hymenolepis microstoma]
MSNHISEKDTPQMPYYDHNDTPQMPHCDHTEIMDSQALPQYEAKSNMDAVTVQQPGHVSVPPVYFGKEPVDTFCVQCNHGIRTSTELMVGPCTHVAAGVICFFGCFCGCCLIPYCVDDCMDILHKCPNCHREMGKFKRC